MTSTAPSECVPDWNPRALSIRYVNLPRLL